MNAVTLEDLVDALKPCIGEVAGLYQNRLHHTPFGAR
jgi:hypothetical protein